MKIWDGKRPKRLFRPDEGTVYVYHDRAEEVDFFDDFFAVGKRTDHPDYGRFHYLVRVPQP